MGSMHQTAKSTLTPRYKPSKSTTNVRYLQGVVYPALGIKGLQLWCYLSVAFQPVKPSR